MRTVKVFLVIFTIVVSLLFIAVSVLFAMEFWDYPISSSPKDWTTTLSYYTLMLPALLAALNLWLILKVNETNALIAQKNLSFHKGKDKLQRVDKILTEFEQILSQVTSSFFHFELPERLMNMHAFLRRMYKYHQSYFDELRDTEEKQKEVLNDIFNLVDLINKHKDINEELELNIDVTKQKFEERTSIRKKAQTLRTEVNDELFRIHDIILNERAKILETLN